MTILDIWISISFIFFVSILMILLIKHFKEVEKKDIAPSPYKERTNRPQTPESNSDANNNIATLY